MELIKEKYRICQNTSSIKNIVAWIIKAIQEDYKAPKGKINKSSFTDYEQRSYDFNDLENKLLGWD